MGNQTFSFNKIKRSFFNVELKDGRKLMVKMPMKKTFEKMTAIQQLDAEDETNIEEAMDSLGGLCAEILSNNMRGERISTEYITENYDFEEMNAFFESFVAFVRGVENNPN